MATLGIRSSKSVIAKTLSVLCNVIFLIASVILVSPTSADKAARGVITHRVSGCDYFVVETKSDFDVLEWYGGYDPDKGDVLIGNYESYGFMTFMMTPQTVLCMFGRTITMFQRKMLWIN